MKRSTPLKRTGFQRKPAAGLTGILAQSSFQRTKSASPKRKAMKSTRPKMTPIRRAARGQECQLQIPSICNHNPETVVLCHSNWLVDGKGMGLKAPDHRAAFGCAACHDVLDGRRPRPDGMTEVDVENYFYVGMRRTHEILADLGLINDGKPSECNRSAA